eukprot:6740695-Heterocapsa_arctica.AAC.1
MHILDARLTAAGATRGSLSNGDDIKSTLRLFGTAINTVFSPYILDACKILELDSPCKIFGGELGGREHLSKIWKTMGTKLTSLHEAIGQVDHGPTEFVLKAT